MLRILWQFVAAAVAALMRLQINSFTP